MSDELPPTLASLSSPAGREPGEVLAKVGDWLAGTKLVWLINPQRATAHVYRQDGSLTTLGQHATLEGEDVLPGFTCALTQVLA